MLRESKRRPGRAALAAGLLGLLMAGSAAWACLPSAALWLVETRPLQRCDLMVVPGGGAKERLYSARELLDDGACGRVLFTEPQEIDNSARAASTPESLDASRIVAAPRASWSTFDDAELALQVARRDGFRDLLVVTSPYHTRRVLWVFGLVLSGSKVRFGVHPSESFYVDYRHWWRSRSGREAVPQEYAKLTLLGLASVVATFAVTASIAGLG